MANNAGNGTYREVFVSSTATLTVELSHESESTVGTVTLSKAGGEGVEYNVVNESGVGLSVEILSTTGASGLLTVLDDRSGSLFLFNERDDVILSWSWNSNGAGTAELADGTAIEFRSFEDWR